MIFLHVGAVLIILCRLGKSLLFSPLIVGVVSRFGHVRAINDSGSRLSQPELCNSIALPDSASVVFSFPIPEMLFVVCIPLLVFGLFWSGNGV